jgi:hypothetical protein
MYGLCVIAWRLNGRQLPGDQARRRVIEMVRDAKV